MNENTRKALELSIQKWEAIVAGTGGDRGSHDCELCTMFLRHDFCRGCPVFQRTGRESCCGTPWDKWTLLVKDQSFHGGRWANTPEQKAAAQDELDFLKSLRP